MSKLGKVKIVVQLLLSLCAHPNTSVTELERNGSDLDFNVEVACSAGVLDIVVIDVVARLPELYEEM